MSILTDALNRLQAERARRLGHPDASATPENAEDADFLDPGVPFFHPSGQASRKTVRVFSIAAALGSVGIAVYLWGLPFMANPDRVAKPDTVVLGPERERKTGTGQREASFTPALAESRKDSRPAEVASVAVPDPPATANRPPVVPVVKNVKSAQSPKSPKSVRNTTSAPARKPRSSAGRPSTANPPPARRVDAASSSQRKPRVPPRLRNATPLQVKLARAQYFIQNRRYAQAMVVLQPLFVKPPEPWEPWFWLGTAQLGLGQWEKARASLVEGLARDATVPQLWVQRALVSQQQGRFGEALDSLRQAELLAPKLPEVQLNLAYALEAQGDRHVAARHYRTFLTLTEGQKAYHATRKKVLHRLVQLRKA